MKNLRRLPKINNAINYLLKDNLKSKNLLINPKFNFTQFQSEEIKISDKEKKFFFFNTKNVYVFFFVLLTTTYFLLKNTFVQCDFPNLQVNFDNLLHFLIL